MNDSPGLELPRYRSHKTVHALQIKQAMRNNVRDNTEGVTLVFEDARYMPQPVKHDVCVRYWPRPGDYFVVYEDGYQSISPKAAFEAGYTKDD